MTRLLASALCLLFTVSTSLADSYENELNKWQSHEDVANWLKSNFSFDKTRQNQISKRLRQQGPSGLLVRNPTALYEENSRGFCGDAVHFSVESLNSIDPGYNARWVFIENRKGRPNHWVAAFDHQGKLHILDYGTGRKWEAMQGVHGPYDSLEEYRDFLASLNLPGFAVGSVRFRPMPGQEE